MFCNVLQSKGALVVVISVRSVSSLLLSFELGREWVPSLLVSVCDMMPCRLGVVKLPMSF